MTTMATRSAGATSGPNLMAQLLGYVRLVPAPWLGRDVYVLYLADLPTGSFKVVPALAAVLKAQREGFGTVLTASAGNFGAGVAWAAQQLGMRAIIVVPQGTSPVRIANCESYNAQVLEYGQDVGQSLAYAEELVGGDVALLHPFDRPEVIEANSFFGQMAYMLWATTGRVDTPRRLYVPCGGGGLAAGLQSVIADTWPECQLVAAEPEDAPSLTAALDHGAPVSVGQVSPWCAASVPRIGDATFTVLARHGAASRLVGRPKAEQAAHLAYIEGVPAELASALAVAAAQQEPTDGSTIVVITGRNDERAQEDA